MTQPEESPTRPDPHIRILLDYPKYGLVRRAWRRLGVLVGGLLVFLGLVASIPALPTSLAVVSFVLGWMTTEPDDPDRWPEPDVPVTEIVVVWAITTPLAIGGIRTGLRLLRRNRRLVLFLRRFGHDEAQSAVTFAVMRTIGASWRLVTLDDAEMAPIGVPTGTRRLFLGGRFISRSILAVGNLAGLRAFPFLLLAMWIIVGIALIDPALDYARTGITSWDRWADALEPYLTILASVLEWHWPIDTVAPTLPGIFALLAMASMVSFGVLIATMAALIAALPLSTVLFFLSESAATVREAEQSKTVAVSSAGDIDQAAFAIARRSRQVFGPRLVVLRVASSVWQQAVRRLARLSSLRLIDISEPTENVLWEVEELLVQSGERFVLIGQYERVAALARRDGEHTPAARRLAALLHGREVLAYTTDRRGLRRFARGLRSLLLALDDAGTDRPAR